MMIQLDLDEKRWKEALQRLLTLIHDGSISLHSKPSGWTHTAAFYIAEAGYHMIQQAERIDADLVEDSIVTLLTKRKDAYLKESLVGLGNILGALHQRSETSFITDKVVAVIKELLASEQGLMNAKFNVSLMRVLLHANEGKLQVPSH